MWKKTSLYILMVFSLGPSALAASSSDSVSAHLTRFAEGFQALFHGSVSGFVDGVVAILSLLGVLAIVFGLTFYLTKLTIFRNDSNVKYARMVALGIALIGLAEQSVYNVVLNMSSTFLILAFIFIIVMMSIMVVNHNRKIHHEVQKEALDAEEDMSKSKKQALKAKHDLKTDKKYYSNARNKLHKLDGDLKEMKHLGSDELRAVDKLINMVTRVQEVQAGEGPSDSNNHSTNEPHSYTKSLNAGIAGLITKMKHEYNYLYYIDDMLNEVFSITRRWGGDEAEQENVDKHLQKIFDSLAEYHRSDGLRKDLKNLKGNDVGIKGDLQELHRNFKRARKKEHRLNELKKKYENHDVKRKQHLAAEARDALTDGDFKKAHNKLGELRQVIVDEREVVKELKDIKQDITSLISHIEMYENRIGRLMKDMESDMKEYESDASSADEDDGK